MTDPSAQPAIEALRLLQASSCFSTGEVCALLPCACAETLAALAEVRDSATEKVIKVAEDVVWFDWSGNDQDAVHAIDQLRLALSALSRPHQSPQDSSGVPHDT